MYCRLMLLEMQSHHKIAYHNGFNFPLSMGLFLAIYMCLANLTYLYLNITPQLRIFFNNMVWELE